MGGHRFHDVFIEMKYGRTGGRETTLPRQVRVHPSSPPSSHHFNSGSTDSSSSSFDFMSSQPYTVTMSKTNVGAGNQFGNLGTNQGSHTNRTSTGMVTPPPLLPFMVGLSLPNFSQLINDPLLHDPNWSTMLIKLPFNIPKFEGNLGEDPTNHVISFHM